MTNKEVIDLYEALLAIQKNENIILPIRVGYVFLKNIKILQPIYESIMETIQTIGNKYGTLVFNEQNQPMFQIDKDKIDLANQELIELNNFNNGEILNLTYLKLQDIENISLPMNYLSAIAILIEE